MLPGVQALLDQGQDGGQITAQQGGGIQPGRFGQTLKIVEKLKGDRKDEYSMRINDQFRLVFTIEKGKHGNTLVILGIEDYH